jgi:hypothetical protein
VAAGREKANQRSAYRRGCFPGEGRAERGRTISGGSGHDRWTGRGGAVTLVIVAPSRIVLPPAAAVLVTRIPVDLLRVASARCRRR